MKNFAVLWKRIATISVILIFTLASTLSVFADSSTLPISVELHGEKIFFTEGDGQPENVNGRVLVPLRKTMESMDAKVEWDPVHQRILVSKGNTIVTLHIGLDNVFVQNGAKTSGDIAIEAAPRITSASRTIVPIRVIAEAFGSVVEWDPTRQTVIIR